MADRESLVQAWSEHDLQSAVLPADREFVEASASLRALVIDLVISSGPPDELYDACAVLGRMIAQRQGTPAMASATIEGAVRALEATDAPWIGPARAAVFEGFAAALSEASRRDAMMAWEFPACAIPLGEAAVAIAAGRPTDDDEELTAWASRVAKAAALAGVRRAVVAGSKRACDALLDACAFVGIEAQAMPRSW